MLLRVLPCKVLEFLRCLKLWASLGQMTYILPDIYQYAANSKILDRVHIIAQRFVRL